MIAHLTSDSLVASFPPFMLRIRYTVFGTDIGAAHARSSTRWGTCSRCSPQCCQPTLCAMPETDACTVVPAQELV
eukprot:2738723-Rhodomonas_salina.8